jgi:hypothetical protein
MNATNKYTGKDMSVTSKLITFVKDKTIQDDSDDDDDDDDI